MHRSPMNFVGQKNVLTLSERPYEYLGIKRHAEIMSYQRNSFGKLIICFASLPYITDVRHLKLEVET